MWNGLIMFLIGLNLVQKAYGKKHKMILIFLNISPHLQNHGYLKG